MACAGSGPRLNGRINRVEILRDQLEQAVKRYLGVPYRLGGESAAGMDCSGLVVRVYRDIVKMRLPHQSASLYNFGDPVSLRALDKGDLVFFREGAGTVPSHVGIYIGRGRFVHASISRGVIQSRLSETYYKNRYIGARRLIR